MIYNTILRTARIVSYVLAAKRIFLEKKKKRIQYVHIQWLTEIFLMELALVVLIRLITPLSASCHLSYFLLHETRLDVANCQRF